MHDSLAPKRLEYKKKWKSVNVCDPIYDFCFLLILKSIISIAFLIISSFIASDH